ncbi:MAG: ABC transporter substrate-binding protein [Dehalococcoidia bacterium]
MRRILFITLAAVLAVSFSLIGCAPDGGEESIVIGIANAESGWIAAYELPARQAAILKIEEINAAGGLLGHQLEYVTADTKTDSAEAVRAAQRVLEDDPVMVIMSSDFDLGAAQALELNDAGVVTFSPGSTDANLGVAGDFLFSMGAVSQAEGFNMAEYAFEELCNGNKTAYVLVDTTTQYTEDVGAGFVARWEELGGVIVGEDTFQNDDPSFSSQVTGVTSLPEEPEIIAVCSYPPGGASLIRDLRSAGVESTIMGDAVFDGDYWLDAVPDLSNFYYPALLSLFGNETDPAKAEVMSNFAAKYGEEPEVGDYIYGYSIVEAWALAVERAGTFEPAAVVEELEKFDHETLTVGNTTYTSELHITRMRAMMIMNIEGGEHSALGYFVSDEEPSMELLFG